MSFKDFLLAIEGSLLPDKPPVPGRPRLNTTHIPRSWYRPQQQTGVPRALVGGTKVVTKPLPASQPRNGPSAAGLGPDDSWAIAMLPFTVARLLGWDLEAPG